MHVNSVPPYHIGYPDSVCYTRMHCTYLKVSMRGPGVEPGLDGWKPPILPLDHPRESRKDVREH